MKRLEYILQHRRPAGSDTEKLCLEELFKPYNYDTLGGNIIICTDTKSETLFSCHTDTGHSEEGKQELIYDANLHTFSVACKSPQWDVHPDGYIMAFNNKWRGRWTCLGADDGAGMWIMLEMIDANVPGTYVFHYGEEKGGIGSNELAKDEVFLKKFKRAIAFDRRGTNDIITSQRGGRCCSDDFATALGTALEAQGLPYAPASGSFTDTANYTGIIPECTNLSCGYYNEHTSDEWLDAKHLEKLRAACIAIDWETLPAARDPREKPSFFSYGGFDPDYNLSFNPYKSRRRAAYSEQDVLSMTKAELEELFFMRSEFAANLIHRIFKKWRINQKSATK